MKKSYQRLARKRKKRILGKIKQGSSPGTLMHMGEEVSYKSILNLMSYDKDTCSELTDINTTELKVKLSSVLNGIKWVSIDGLHDLDKIRSIGEIFNIHPLALEDILNTTQRPKVDEYDDYVVVVAKTLVQDKDSGEIGIEQISVVIKDGIIITFQEKESDTFNGLRDRIRHGKGRVRNMKADYLLFAILDSVVDNYFLLLEKFETKIYDLESTYNEANPGGDSLNELHNLNQELLNLQRNIKPLKNVTYNLLRTESPLFSSDTEIFYRDLNDNMLQVKDAISTYKELISSTLETRLLNASHKLNEVMKFLTVITSIFIPLSFISSIYGMNFKHMPELEWAWGYPAAIISMLALGLVMAWQFRKRGWI